MPMPRGYLLCSGISRPNMMNYGSDYNLGIAAQDML